MNSEELEQSLRTEFESYLKDVLVEVKQEVSDFQEKIESEFEKHRSQLGETFGDLSKKIGERKEIDISFKESVSEHLKLARDEGAKITAAAIAEAEEMREDEEDALADFSSVRDAINEISNKDSQSGILKSLVHHAAQYTSRGAFFIVKNKHLVGWRLFGTDEQPDPDIIKRVYFPISSNTSLSESISTLATIESGFGIHEDDSLFLEKLDFGEPSGMYSIPLVVRGRGVAVLYADRGAEDGSVNVEALESLIRVAGLTVDILASNMGAAKSAAAVETEYAVDEAETDQHDEARNEQQDVEPTGDFNAFAPPEVAEPVAASEEYEVIEQETNESDAWNQPMDSSTPEFSTPVDEIPVPSESLGAETEESNVSSFDESALSLQSEVETGTVELDSTSETFESPNPYSDFETQNYDISETSSPQTEEPVAETFDFESDQTATSFEQSVDASVETAVAEPVSSPPVRSRFGDRNVDLPIEVEENERRHHNDARRFARLLVSEIKLYNEQKVKEGRETRDLYERLREAIDRSREMYDKRVQPPVAAKFDYFNYELVNTLAEGDENKLGNGYPGASV